MKKRMFSLILCLLLMASLVIPVSAAYEYGNYYDETEELWTEGLESMGIDTMVPLSKALGMDIRLDVFTSLGDDGIVATAEYVFDNYYGSDTNGNGVSLSIYVLEDNDGWYMEQWYIHLSDNTGKWKGLDSYLSDYVIDGFTFAAWEGDLRQDCQNMELICGLLTAGVSQFAAENGLLGNTAAAPTQQPATTPAPAVTTAPVTNNTPVEGAAVLDFATEGNVIDLSGVLSINQDEALEAMITEISNPYQCGCYIVVTPDLYAYGEEASEAVINLYHDNNLGMNETRDGILLLMDPVNRKFAFFVYGKNAEYIFNSYGQDLLEDVFLDDFGNNQWYDGLEDFVEECGEYMELAAQGNPVAQSKTLYYVAAVLGALVISAIVCFVLVSKMKSVATANDATNYVAASGLMLTERTDVFAYKTTSTRDISDDDDDSSSFSGGGGSGRSGSF